MKITDLFRCPDCGGNRLEEIETGCVCSTEVVELGEGGDADYGPTSIDDGETERFQCVNCGWKVPGVTNTEELWELLNSKDSPCKPMQGPKIGVVSAEQIGQNPNLSLSPKDYLK